MIIVRPLIPPFIPMGMDKSGTHSTPKSTTNKVTGWVERSGFPGSNIVNDELVVNGNGNITVSMSFTRTFENSSSQAYIYKNGVQVATTGNMSFDTTRTLSWTGDVVVGDTLSVWHKNASAFNPENVTGGYIYYTINSVA